MKKQEVLKVIGTSTTELERYLSDGYTVASMSSATFGCSTSMRIQTIVILNPPKED